MPLPRKVKQKKKEKFIKLPDIANYRADYAKQFYEIRL